MIILKCDSFDGVISGRHNTSCCAGCHEENILIPVTPFTEDSTREVKHVDYELGIEAMVCCGKYEYVRSLSREWWVRKLAEVDGWSRERLLSKLHAGSWHPDLGNRPRPMVTSTVGKRRKSGCPNCGAKWNEVVCEECGHVG